MSGILGTSDGTTTGDLVSCCLGAADTEGAAPAAVRCLVDWAGCAVAGSRDDLAGVLLASSAVLGQGSACTVIGREERATPAVAALVNGASSHVLDFDDVNVTMIGHPAVVVVPAVLALAEAVGASGTTVLRAVAAGYELSERLGAMLNPGHYERGWHATATIGCAAAALASGVVYGLDDRGLGVAVGLGLTQAGGVRAVFGTHGKGFHAGRAAMAGLLGATLARAGAQVPPDILEGTGGYLEVASASQRQELPGPPPAVLRTAFKPHAACGATHCLIDAVAAIVREEGLAAGEIASIRARVHPLAVRAAGIREPRTGLEAKFSLWHVAAMATTTWPLLPVAFEDRAFATSEILDLRARVSIEVDEGFAYEQAMPAAVTVMTASGSSHERYVDTPRGRPANPMTDGELDAKFTSLAGDVLGPERAERALRLVRAVGQAPTVRPLLAGLAP